MFQLLAPIALMITPFSPQTETAPLLLLAPLDAGGLTAVPVGPFRDFALDGPAILREAMENCTYRHARQGRAHYYFMVDWGDGTMFSITDGVPDTSCADQFTHVYAQPGPYTITVSIRATGATDGLDQIYEGAYTLWD